MLVYEGDGLGDIYYKIMRDLTEMGRHVTTRGQRCLEFKEPVTLVYRRPGACWMRIPGRKWNPFLAMAEVFWILAGSGEVKPISFFSSYIKNFQDGERPDFHGAYGLRIRKWPWYDSKFEHIDQIAHVVRKLTEDPQSRQAVIALWDPARDNLYKSKDYPCNNMVYYALRDGVLNQTVVIRSNDLIWGTTYNAVQFTHLHSLIAGLVGATMGTFTYVIQNLHYYMDLYPQVLANVIEEAYTGSPIHAQMADEFGPFYDIRLLEATWGTICEMQKNDSSPEWERYFKGIGGAFESTVGWTVTYFRAIALFSYLKRLPTESTIPIDVLVKFLHTIEEPIRSLMLDFWADSKKPVVQELWKACQSNRSI